MENTFKMQNTYSFLPKLCSHFFKSPINHEKMRIEKNAERQHLENCMKKVCTKFHEGTTMGNTSKTWKSLSFLPKLCSHIFKSPINHEKMRNEKNAERQHLENCIKKVCTKFHEPPTMGNTSKTRNTFSVGRSRKNYKAETAILKIA